MAHARKAIRERVTTVLTGLTTTGARVYQSRVYPMREAQLPGLLIFTESETMELASLTPPRTQQRTLNLVVEAYVRGVSNYDSDLDIIAEEVEEALTADLTLNSLARDLSVVGFEAEFSGEGDQPLATGRFTVEINYITVENAVNASV